MMNRTGRFPSDEELSDFIQENREDFKSTRTAQATRTFMHLFHKSKHAKNPLYST